MKVLHIGLMVNPMLNVGLSKAFRNASTEYAEVSLNENIDSELSSLKIIPEIVFVQVQNDKIGNRRTNEILNPWMEKFNKQAAVVINWTGDMRNTIPHWMLDFKAHITCFSNMRDVRLCRERGKKSEFLQIGIDPVNFNRNHKLSDLPAANAFPLNNLPEVVFMGNNSGHFPLSNYRLQVVKKLVKHFGDRAGIYGNGYPHSRGSLNASPDNPFLMQSLESYIYSQSKVAISVSHYNSDRYHSDRLLRAMGSGACVLSHAYEGIHSDWTVGKELDVFDNFVDLVDKIEYYLNNESRRKAIAEAGYKRVQKDFTYDNMVENIFQIYKSYLQQ